MFKQLWLPKKYDLLGQGKGRIHYKMASRPRKRKTVNNPGTQSNGNDAASQDMVEKCFAAILQTIKVTIQDVISSQSPSTPQPQFSQDNQEFNSLTLQLITGAFIDKGDST